MYRSINAEDHFSQRGSVPRTAGLEVRGDSSASSWISMLTAVSRPAWALLQKYLPAKSQTWSSDAGKSSIDFGQKLMAGLDNLMPRGQSPTHLHVAHVHCRHENGAFFTSGDVETLGWLTADPLRELGIQEDVSMNFNVQQTTPMEYRYLTTTRKFLSRFLAPKERKHTESVLVGYPSPIIRANNIWWWQGLWSSRSLQNILYETKTSADSETQTPHCKDHHSSDHCKVNCQRSADEPVELLGHNNQVEWTCSECAGPSHYKQSAGHAACSSVAVLTPDQDNGYSSFEEESVSAGRCNMNTVCELLDLDSSTGSPAGDHGHGGERDKSAGNTPCERIENKEEDKEDKNVQNAEPVIVHEALPVHSTPRCLNKAIAYIMGSPCSDESDTEDSIPDGDDDDGFDSDDLDTCSDSEDLEDSDDEEDEEDSESDELDSESEKLWTSLCQTRDPYNPRNFTAPIQTSQKLSESAVNSCTAGSPVQPESLLCSSQLSPPSPLEGPQKDMESSEEACSSMDEAESLRLWDSFSCSSDPYSPLNFRAAIRTRQPARRRCKKQPLIEPLVYRKEEAEERMDSGFSETAISQGVESAGVVRLKKVTFMEEVEEFYASSDEERRGPWEEYARDRCRFQRRVQEVETSIGYCLSPTFRLKVFQRHYSSS